MRLVSYTSTLISYSSVDEVIVCSPEDEKGMLLEWFLNTGRNLDDYDRKTHSKPIEINNRLVVG